MPLELNIEQIRGWMAEAGEIALGYFGNVAAEWKGVADPVTEADRAIERLLTGYLREAFPHHAILGEEYGGETLDRHFIWTVDAIDGPRVFVEGLPPGRIAIPRIEDCAPSSGTGCISLLYVLT